MGSFHFGSTIILLFEPGRIDLAGLEPGDPAPGRRGPGPTARPVVHCSAMKLLALATILLLPLRGDDPKDLDFQVLSGFEYTQGMDLPKKVKDLHGKKVKLTGFGRSADGEVKDVGWFWLVNQNCDCEGAPKMNEMVFAILSEGETIDLKDEPIKVEGTLSVGEDKDGEYVLSLYRMAVTKVRD
ncbi:MAG: DUF3299 domain-containing protein [Planctomycetota bacterium]